jgi:hypothetical protein
MRFFRLFGVSVLVLLLIGSVALAQDEQQTEKKASFALTVGKIYPTNSRTSDDFGGSWTRFGLTSFDPVKPNNWRLSVEGSAYRLNGEGRVRIYPITAGVIRGWNLNSKTQTYVALRTGPYWGSFDSDTLGIDENKIGLNTNAAVGMVFKKKIYAEVRYDFFSEIGGYRFDGVSVSVGLHLFDVKF